MRQRDDAVDGAAEGTRTTEGDEALLRRYPQDPAGVAERLYQRHARTAVRIARRSGADPEEAEDAVAEAFVRILGMLAEGRGPQRSFLRYLVRTVATVQRERRSGPSPQDPQSPEAMPLAETTEAVAGRREEARIVTRAYQDLPPRWRTILWGLDVEGRAPRELAAELEMTPNAVSQAAVRARERLREGYLSHYALRPATGECAEYAPMLPQLVRGRLTSARRRRLLQHLETCPRCSAEHLALVSTSDLMRGWVLPGMVLGGALLGGRAARATAAPTDAGRADVGSSGSAQRRTPGDSGWPTGARRERGDRHRPTRRSGTRRRASVAVLAALLFFGSSPHLGPESAVPLPSFMEGAADVAAASETAAEAPTPAVPTGTTATSAPPQRWSASPDSTAGASATPSGTATPEPRAATADPASASAAVARPAATASQRPSARRDAVSPSGPALGASGPEPASTGKRAAAGRVRAAVRTAAPDLAEASARPSSSSAPPRSGVSEPPAAPAATRPPRSDDARPLEPVPAPQTPTATPTADVRPAAAAAVPTSPAALPAPPRRLGGAAAATSSAAAEPTPSRQPTSDPTPSPTDPVRPAPDPVVPRDPDCSTGPTGVGHRDDPGSRRWCGGPWLRPASPCRAWTRPVRHVDAGWAPRRTWHPEAAVRYRVVRYR
ncbi:sigma-70 family RNA polymerase sigma factor [Rothia kristinae]|uniref:Sigma-70 family RNA polymerase sigma factor n=1 Tax=Rothia kristinae TaxID=37923 RepID=A0A7T4T3X8_9MICC|nr:sigma-70 family RNA polymerase sigma factor [Rothia kristinae]QQC59042.1 sigma-70 family RNA polymerase sigma factor [Rothia kristinae]